MFKGFFLKSLASIVLSLIIATASFSGLTHEEGNSTSENTCSKPADGKPFYWLFPCDDYYSSAINTAGLTFSIVSTGALIASVIFASTMTILALRH